jgi:HEAT repeat protein
MKNKTIFILFSIISLIFLITLPVFAQSMKRTVRNLERKQTRREAIRKLSKGGKSSAKYLRKLAINRKKDRDSRVAAILLLGKIKDKNSSQDLVDILENDQDQHCQEAAVISLGNLGNKKSLPRLRKAMKNKNRSVNIRMRAAQAMAKSGKKDALTTLREDKNATGKLLAVEALAEMAKMDIWKAS